MSDLKLVAPDQPTPFERRLLDAVANESPSAEQRMRVRLALGLPVASAPLPVTPVGRRALLLKAAGGLIVVSAGMFLLLSGIGRKPTPAEQAVPSMATQSTLVAPPATAVAPIEPAAPAAAPPTSGEHDDTVPSKRSGKVAVRASSSSAPEDGADLAEQLRLIDAARSAVAAGNASAASAALSSYRARFPRGPFGQEAAVLQIETLDLQGNHAQAAAQARTFLARHPNSPHVNVVQRIAGR